MFAEEKPLIARYRARFRWLRRSLFSNSPFHLLLYILFGSVRRVGLAGLRRGIIQHGARRTAARRHFSQEDFIKINLLLFFLSCHAYSSSTILQISAHRESRQHSATKDRSPGKSVERHIAPPSGRNSLLKRRRCGMLVCIIGSPNAAKAFSYRSYLSLIHI